MARGTYATINLDALVYNFLQVKHLSPRSKHVAVIKADAYGNGAIPVAKALSPYTNMFAVAFLEEAIALREAGITLPILVLQGPYAYQELENTKTLNFHWVLHTETQMAWFSEYLSHSDIQGHQWVKVDSGMHRLGLPMNEFDDLMRRYPKVMSNKCVIMTHLAAADEDDQTQTNIQINSFLSKVSASDFALSIANSAGAIALPKARQNFNRIGISTYGSAPFCSDRQITLRPVMTLSASIIAIREIPKGDTVGYGMTWQATKPTTIATVAIGYADGYPRHAKNGTPAVLHNRRISLVGRVSMDMITYDISNVENVKIGDMVELWGNQLPINEIASYVGTIGYELMTRVSKRVPRKYIHAKEKT